MARTLIPTLESAMRGRVRTEKEFLDFYSVDASSYRTVPRAVILPETARDVVAAVRTARRFGTSVTARGAGTGLVGGALNSGIILDMRNLDSCRIYRNHATVGPGLSKGRLDLMLGRCGKFFAPNPSVGAFCTVGGMLGNNASGSRSLKYGSVIDNVLQVTFVDGRGRVITLPDDARISKKIFRLARRIESGRFPDTSKNSSGYRIDAVKKPGDAHRIIAGSEGTLGIVVSAKIRILDVPRDRALCIVPYGSVIRAARDCVKIKDTGPASVEFVDGTILRNIAYEFPKGTRCALFVEYDADVSARVGDLRRAVPGRVVAVRGRGRIRRWREYRDRSLYYSLASAKKEHRLPHVIEDAAVPLGSLPGLFEAITSIDRRFDTRSVTYGHAGDGNIHLRLAARRPSPSMMRKIAAEYLKKVIDMRGTITAEHGDGLARSAFVSDQYGPRNYDIFQDLKDIFDPDNVLNPGKIIIGRA